MKVTTKEAISAPQLLEMFFKCMDHFFPKFIKWMSEMPDPRHAKMITYPIELLILQGIFLFIFKLESRRNLNFKLREQDAFKENLLNWLALKGREQSIEKLPDEDTPAYLYKQLTPDSLCEVRAAMIQRLIRMRALEKFRLFGVYYTVAIDGTWELTFGDQKHCSGCLRIKKGEDEEGNPKYIYYHAVLEAKLICANGLSLSMGTEFIENIDVDESKGLEEQKQDCELKAFYRLALKIKRDYPQLKICLLLDGLYTAKPVFDICEKNQWKHIITFKEGAMPAVYAEYEALKKLAPEDCGHWERGEASQNYRWVNGIDYQGHKLNVLECCETKQDEKETRFVWITNFSINPDKIREIKELVNKGGRCRWKIENEGFNVQKNGGYELEHAYCLDPTAIKNFYLLLQIAHIINQLMEKGSLLKDKLQKTFGSVKNFAAALYHAFISCVFHFDAGFIARRIQIRFSHDSS